MDKISVDGIKFPFVIENPLSREQSDRWKLNLTWEVLHVFLIKKTTSFKNHYIILIKGLFRKQYLEWAWNVDAISWINIGFQWTHAGWCTKSYYFQSKLYNVCFIIKSVQILYIYMRIDINFIIFVLKYNSCNICKLYWSLIYNDSILLLYSNFFFLRLFLPQAVYFNRLSCTILLMLFTDCRLGINYE